MNELFSDWPILNCGHGFLYGDWGPITLAPLQMQIDGMLLQTVVLERGDAIYVPPNVVYQVCNLPERFYSISKQKFLFQYSGTNATRILSVPVLSLIWATEWIEILFSSDVKVFYILQHTKFISNFYDHFSAYSSTPCWTMKLCEKLRRFGNA